MYVRSKNMNFKNAKNFLQSPGTLLFPLSSLFRGHCEKQNQCITFGFIWACWAVTPAPSSCPPHPPPTHHSPLHLQPTMCRQQIYSHQDEAWCGFVIKPLSLRIDWDKDEHEVYITVSVDSLRTPTSRVIWLQLHGWCVGPEREVNKAEKKEGGHMWIAHTVVHTHTHTCAMFSPAVSTFCFSQGLWQRAVEQNSSPPPPIMSTREHTFLRGLEMSRLAEFEVYLRG